MDACPSPYCWLTPKYGCLDCLDLSTSVLYPSNLSNAMWYQSSKSILCFQSNKRYWSRSPLTVFVQSRSLITRYWSTCFFMSVMSLLLMQEIYVQIQIYRPINVSWPHVWSCVTRAPLLYFIRSWVALSFKVVSEWVRNPWRLFRSPLKSITNCYRLIVSYTDPVHSFIIS